MPLTSRPLAPQHASTRCLISVLLSTQIAMKRHGAGCGDVRLGCWQIAGSSGHRRLSVIARSASRWTRAPAVQCCPRMISGRASSERRSFIRYDKVSRSRGSNWRRGCRGGGPLGTGWRLKGHAPDAVLALSAPAPPSYIVVRLSRMATRPPCAAVDLRRDSDHHARAAHPRCATDVIARRQRCEARADKQLRSKRPEAAGPPMPDRPVARELPAWDDRS
jgi:hypothetical protein